MGSRVVTSNTFHGATQINQGDVFNSTYSSELLPAARGAAFDSHAEEHNAQCLPDTRIGLLRQIKEWADNPRAECIYWLNGMAGSGKSTIARTIALRFKAQGWLGASFFFKRGERDRGNADLFFTTIASQFVSAERALEQHVRDALHADPALPGKALGEQFEKLILQPLAKAHSLSQTTAKVVVVIDALDECDRDDDIKLIIHLLSKTRSLVAGQIKIFVTSRPELPIRLGFEKIQGKYKEVTLHTIPQRTIGHDIAVFFRHELERIRKDYNSSVHEDRKLPEHWPGELVIQELVHRAVPLFIYAATVCRFIQDQRCSRPVKQLATILEYPTHILASKLDGAYQPVLDQLLVDLAGPQRQNVVDKFQHAVGTIIVLADPLSTSSLAALIGMDQTDVEDTLNPLHSVLRMPSTFDTESPIRLLHLSFRDYLIDPSRRSENPFWMDEAQRHGLVAGRCLQLLCGYLRKDVCNLKMPGISRASVEAVTIKVCLPTHIQYACLFWVYHFEQGKGCVIDGEQVHEFLKDHLLHWLEAMSFMGKTSESIVAINTLLALVQAGASENVTAFLRDANRFILHFQSIIDASPLQLYSSAIIFSPERSIIRNTFEKNGPKWISRLPEVDLDWSACLQTLEGHTDTVRSVAFSRDNKYIVSASEDRTIKVWDTLTGKLLHTLEGHIYNATSAMFSSDNRYIMSGSIDKTIRIWDAITGQHLQTVENRSGGINSVVFSHNSKRFASGSFDKTVKIWETATGVCLQTFQGHNGSVHSVAFSPDDEHLASASDDKSVKIWDVTTGKCLETLRKHDSPVKSVAFSDDGRRLVSTSSDLTLKIWDITTGVCIQTLKGHNSIINSAAFSHDGKHVASASSDNMIKIWDAASGRCLQVLEGHASFVTSVTYSNDNLHIASASGDKTIKIWSTATENYAYTFRNSVRRAVTLVTFSLDNKYLASVSNITIKLWDVVTGTCLQTLKGHKRSYDSILAVAFSPDNKRIASGAGDMTIKTWDFVTGKCLLTLGNQENFILSVAFSRDGKRLVAAFEKHHPIRVWDSFTGHLIMVVDSYYGKFSAVSFFPNGKSLALASCFDTINTWEVPTYRALTPTQCLQTLEGHSDKITAVAVSQNGLHLYSASEDHTVKVWDTASAKCLFTYDVGRIINTILPGTTNSHLWTEVGAFALNSPLVPETAAEAPGIQQARPVGYGLNLDGTWITWNSDKLLWLPPRYRLLDTVVGGRVRAAVGGSTVAIGFESERPMILNFSAEDAPVA